MCTYRTTPFRTFASPSRVDLRRLRFEFCAALCLWGASAVAVDEAEMSLGFDSVSAAYKALTNDPQAEVSRVDGWTIVKFDLDFARGQTTWSFTPVGSNAYPALVRRDAVMKAGKPTLVTRLLCESTRAACDALFESLGAEDQALSKDLADD